MPTKPGKARRDLLAQADQGQLRPAAAGITVGELLDAYLDGLDADGRLSEKTRFDYRHYTDHYVRPHLGNKRVRDVTPEVVLSWQRKLSQQGGTKTQKPLAPNSVRLARAPLAGAFKLALSAGMVAVNPIAGLPGPAQPGPFPVTGVPSRPGSSSR